VVDGVPMLSSTPLRPLPEPDELRFSTDDADAAPGGIKFMQGRNRFSALRL